MEAETRTDDKVAALTRDLEQTLEQQAASSAILRVIAATPVDIQPVLQVVAESAARFCETDDAAILLRRGDFLDVKAHHGPIPMDPRPFAIDRGWVAGRAVLDQTTLHVADLLATGDEYPLGQSIARSVGYRTIAVAPLPGDDGAIGVLTIRRNEVRPFTDRQIGLLGTFADQAAIAIQNARLFEQVQARTAEVTEALQQQTATAEVLKVISRSAFDLDAVLTTLVASAIQLCEATRGVVWLMRDGALYLAAHVNCEEEWVRFGSALTITPAADSSTTSGLAAFTGEILNVEDIPADPRFRSLEGHRLGDYHGGLAVPLKRDGEVIGTISLSRPEARRFTNRQVALVQTFADQAVIAIENARLFGELQARTAELSESLQQQTATADVLDVISRSIVELKPVFDAILENAARICGASFGNLALREGDAMRHVAAHGATPEWEEFYGSGTSMHPGPHTAMGRVLATGRHVHIDDIMDDAAFAERDPLRMNVVRLLGARTMLCVPLLKSDEVVGTITIHRTEVRPFTEKQIALITSFASQAVIAIENARLFSELEKRNREVSEALEQQTATADVLRIISRSAFDLDSVLDTLARSSSELCGADEAIIFLRSGEEYHAQATYGADPSLLDFLKANPRRKGQRSVVPRVIETGAVVHIPDKLLDDDYAFPGAVQYSDTRAMLGVPMLRDGIVEGVFVVSRRAAGAFSERRVALLQIFADQAMIAIENARLFAELEARNREILARYFSPSIADRLAGGVDEIELAGQRRDVAAVFTDIEGFTSLIETMEPAMLSELLNGYLGGMTEIVFRHEGTVAKIIGDALHILFGAPGDQPDRAERAVRCALDLDAWAQSFRQAWGARGIDLGVTRIGVNAGPAVVGNFGGGRFFDYTAYGDTINMAARLETANKQLGTRICVSETAAMQVVNFRGRPVGNLMLRGRAEPLRAFEPLHPERHEDPSLSNYLDAFAKLERGEPAALAAFAAEVGRNPDDRLSTFHLKRLLNGETGARIIME